MSNKKDKSIWKSLSSIIKKKLSKKALGTSDYPDNPEPWQINLLKKHDEDDIFGNYQSKK